MILFLEYIVLLFTYYIYATFTILFNLFLSFLSLFPFLPLFSFFFIIYCSCYFVFFPLICYYVCSFSSQILHIFLLLSSLYLLPLHSLQHLNLAIVVLVLCPFLCVQGLPKLSNIICSFCCHSIFVFHSYSFCISLPRLILDFILFLLPLTFFSPYYLLIHSSILLFPLSSFASLYQWFVPPPL